ncbi:hypothetical protein [Vibrio lentus]|uniref:hypothetical protein n=1 Tax=Vibrio lentus TaxID=136468 RepID=UPI001E4488AF|nr:hypothetical protein [Vibrio lentus]MCC4838116.1 hypothetical protein [Vibrio lentus]
MITTAEQWHNWIKAIQVDLAKCEITEALESIGDKIATLLGYASESDLLESRPLEVDLFPSIIGENSLEASFHDYVNRNSFIPEDNPFAPTKLYYPPCRTIVSLLPKGITLSPNMVEWVWVNIVMNASLDSDGEELLPIDIVKEHKSLKLITGSEGRYLASGIAEQTIAQVNDACFMVSRGRFEPFIIE